MTDKSVIFATAEIVCAHVGNNKVGTTELVRLIDSVYNALAHTGAPEPVAAQSPAPAVSIRTSVKKDGLFCLECGAKMKMLKRHLRADHELTPGEYRARWGLPHSYPMVAAEYSNRRKALALEIGLGRKKIEGSGENEPVAAGGDLALAD